MTRRLLLAAACVAWQIFGPVPAVAQTPTDSDLMALRFYVGEGNDRAVQSEIRRLQLEYPDWMPPENLTEVNREVPAETIDRIYALIQVNDVSGARAEIEKARQDYPDWSPSEELLQTIAIADGQARFTHAVESGDANAAIRIARGNPALLRCERVNNAWLLAEQYQVIDQGASALAVYRSIMRSCGAADILIATLEKSAAISDIAALADLAELARERAPDASERLTETENQLRAGLNASPKDLPVPPVTVPTIADTQGVMETSPRPPARPVALNTQSAALRSSSGGSAAQPTAAGAGGGTDLSRAGQAAASGNWQGCLALTANARSGAALSQRGWCALNANRAMQALDDFRKAAATAPTVRSRRDSAYGMALSMLRLDMVDQAAAVAADVHFDKNQRLEIESQILDKRGIFAYDRGDYRRAIAYFNELERLTGRTRRDLALLRGYAYLNSGQRTAAVAEFRRLHNQMATPASRRALSEALN